MRRPVRARPLDSPPSFRTSHLVVPTAAAQEAEEMKRLPLQPRASHSCPRLPTSSRQHRYVAFLFLTLIFKGRSVHCLNVLLTALLEQSRQHHGPARAASGLRAAASAERYPKNHAELWTRRHTCGGQRQRPRVRPWLPQGLCKLAVWFCFLPGVV